MVVINEEHAHLWLTNIAVRYNNLQYNVIAVMWRDASDSEDDRTLHDERMTEPGLDLSRHNKL